jgi:WD40 repeat protein
MTSRTDTQKDSKDKGDKRPKYWKDRLRGQHGHKDSVIFVHSLGEGKLLTISSDASLRLWDLTLKQFKKKLDLQPPKPEAPELGHTSAKGGVAVKQVAAKPCGLCTVFTYLASLPNGSDGTMTIVLGGYESGRVAAWDAEDGEVIGDFSGHTNAVTTLAVCGTQLISASFDGSIRIWALDASSMAAAECKFVLEFGDENPVADFSLLNHGDRLAACSWDGNLRIIDLKTRECTGIAEVSSTAGLRSLCVSEAATGETLMYMGTEDCRISCWKLYVSGELAEMRSWKAHDQDVTEMKIAYDKLFSCSEDRTIRIWDLRTGFFLDEMRGHEGGISSLCIADKLCWSGSRDTTIRSWDLMDMDLRIWERKQMRREDLLSHQVEKYTAIMGVGKKKAVSKRAASKKAGKRKKA